MNIINSSQRNTSSFTDCKRPNQYELQYFETLPLIERIELIRCEIRNNLENPEGFSFSRSISQNTQGLFNSLPKETQRELLFEYPADVRVLLVRNFEQLMHLHTEAPANLIAETLSATTHAEHLFALLNQTTKEAVFEKLSFETQQILGLKPTETLQLLNTLPLEQKTKYIEKAIENDLNNRSYLSYLNPFFSSSISETTQLLFASLPDEMQRHLFLECPIEAREQLVPNLEVQVKLLENAPNVEIAKTLQASSNPTQLFTLLNPESQIAIFPTLKRSLKQTFKMIYAQALNKSNSTLEQIAELITISTHREVANILSNLTTHQKIELRKLLPQDTLDFLNFFNRANFAHRIVTSEGFPLNSTTALYNWLAQVETGANNKEFQYGAVFGPKSAAIQNYTCTDQQRAQDTCLFNKISQLIISCIETSNSAENWVSNKAPLSSVSGGLPTNCKVMIFGDKTQQEQTFSSSDDFEKLGPFVSYIMPQLNPQKRNDETVLSFETLQKLAKGQDGVEFTSSFSSTSGMSADALNLFFPGGKTHPNQLNQKNRNPEFRINNLFPTETATLVTQMWTKVTNAGQSVMAHFRVSASGLPSKKLSYSETPDGTKTLNANNPTYLKNYAEVLNQSGIPYKFSGQTLLLAQGDEAKVHTNPFSKSGSYFPGGTIKRASDLAVYNIFPAIVGALAVAESLKFIKSAINQPKKTLGQKVAGSFVGGLGVLAGIALAYNRLSEIKVFV